MTRLLVDWPVSEVNKFSGKVQDKIHHFVVAKRKKVMPLSKKKILTTEKVTTSEEVDKGTSWT